MYIKETQSRRKSYVLLISSTFRYTQLCKHINHYTLRTDYNYELYHFIILCIFICLPLIWWETLLLKEYCWHFLHFVFMESRMLVAFHFVRISDWTKY